jgi:AraC-like DNA-binding protein
MNAIIGLPEPPTGAACRTALLLWRTKRLFGHIERNLSERIGLLELSDVVRLSPTHLSRTFKRHFGVSLHVYVLCRRVVLAQNLMLMTKYPLKDIALECGLTDQPHLTRVFRAMVGATPACWRETHLAALDRGEIVLPLDTTAHLLRRWHADAGHKCWASELSARSKFQSVLRETLS